MSQITTHILDTSLGRPAAGVTVVLHDWAHAAGWREIARGFTDADGRLARCVVGLYWSSRVFLTARGR